MLVNVVLRVLKKLFLIEEKVDMNSIIINYEVLNSIATKEAKLDTGTSCKQELWLHVG